MNEKQSKLFDELTQRVLNLEKQIEQVSSNKLESGTLSQKDRYLIQKLLDEVRKPNGMFQQLAKELIGMRNLPLLQPIPVSSATSSTTKTYNGKSIYHSVGP